MCNLSHLMCGHFSHLDHLAFRPLFIATYVSLHQMTSAKLVATEYAHCYVVQKSNCQWAALMGRSEMWPNMGILVVM